MNAFNEKLQSYIDILDIKNRATYTIKIQTYGEILKVLKSKDSQESAAFKFWVRNNFVLREMGTDEIIYDEKKQTNKVAYYHIRINL